MTWDRSAPVPAGWYRDPAGGPLERYFDGAAWSEQTRPLELRPRAPRTPAPLPEPVAATAPAAAAEHAPGAAGAPARPSVFGMLPGGLPAFPAGPPRPATHTAAQRVAGRAHASLTDALSAALAPDSAQQLLLGTGAARAPRHRAAAAASGWYPDPARGGSLRFFDGHAWTARTRPVVGDGVRRLPQAALRLRAAFLEAQDAAALRRGGHPRRAARLVIPRESAAPSLHLRARSRSGSLWGMLSTMLAVAGLVAAGFFAWQLWGSDYYNTFQQRDLAQQLRAEPVPAAGGFGDLPVTVTTAPATEPAPAPAHTPARPRTATAPVVTEKVSIAPNTSQDGRPVGRIRIPAIGLDRVFVLGTDPDQLALGPGLWKWGAFPGTPGNTTISGHRTTHGAPFRHLDSLRYGDRILIDVPGQPEAVYEVRGTTIADPFDVHVTAQTPGVRLTLTTCNPVGSAAQRLVVEAELVSGRFAAQAVPRAAWHVQH